MMRGLVIGVLVPILSVAPGASTRSSSAPARTVKRTFAEATNTYDSTLKKAETEYYTTMTTAKRAYVADLAGALTAAFKAQDLDRANQIQATKDRVERELAELQK